MRALNGLVDKAAFWLAPKVASCGRVAFLISQSLDRKLARYELLTLRLHSRGCKFCRFYSAHLAYLRKVVRRCWDEQGVHNNPSASLSGGARERIDTAIRSAWE